MNYYASTNPKVKKLTFIRHGTTEMNEQMDVWGAPGFTDKKLYDTILSQKGKKLSEDFNERILNHNTYNNNENTIHRDIQNAELIITSPLKRTLQTTSIVLKNVHSKSINKLVLPLATERVYLSSDIGSNKSVLIKEFPEFDFSLIDENESWWYSQNNDSQNESLQYNNQNLYKEWRPPGIYAVPGEPKEIFKLRMIKLYEWLLNRKEERIVIVTHWGVIKYLTGKNFKNCEAQTVLSNELLLLDSNIDH